MSLAPPVNSTDAEPFSIDPDFKPLLPYPNSMKITFLSPAIAVLVCSPDAWLAKQINRMRPSPSPKTNSSTWMALRSGAWPGLLLAGCCAVLTGLAHPARAAVTEAWVQRSINKWVSSSDDAATKVVRDAAGDI